jgi:hypothetical protein
VVRVAGSFAPGTFDSTFVLPPGAEVVKTVMAIGITGSRFPVAGVGITVGTPSFPSLFMNVNQNTPFVNGYYVTRGPYNGVNEVVRVTITGGPSAGDFECFVHFVEAYDA